MGKGLTKCLYDRYASLLLLSLSWLVTPLMRCSGPHLDIVLAHINIIIEQTISQHLAFEFGNF